MLYNIIIKPIEIIVDWCFIFITNQFSSFGIIGALIGVSLVINILALPLYNIADNLQDKERKIAKQLEPRIKRIKKAFKGDEQFMMLSTYYSQNNYHPLYVLRSSLSILIEIPFFIAAYHYLSNCESLRGASFWIFKDLGAPDCLFNITLGSFNFPIHILPIIMTLINFVSGAIYTKDATFKEKFQLYAIAIIFLALLYNSPSGLVIYWILNNIFSLVKNVVMRIKKPGKILFIFISIFLFLISVYYIFLTEITWYKKFIVLLISIIFASSPFIFKLIKRFIKLNNKEENSNTNLILLILSGLGLTLLCGYLLPSSVIASSTSEFCFLGETPSPLSYIWSSLFIFFGLFLFWPICIYKMFGAKVKSIEPFLFFILLICALTNTYFFKATYGSLNVLFMIGNPDTLNLSIKIYLLSFFTLIFLLAFVYFLKKYNKLSWLSIITFSICIAEFGLGTIKTSHINKEFAYYNSIKNEKSKESQLEPIYHLSKNDKNVVIIFLDRAINSFIPKIFEDNTDIKDAYNGFIYYPNTLSFSNFTVMGTPPMMGGYEYTQINTNLRTSELLKNKNDEADMVMAKLFSDAGFEATISDPPWAGYSYGGDLTNFKKHPEFRTLQKEGDYFSNYLLEKDTSVMDNIDMLCKKEIINFTILEVLPPMFRKRFYKDCKNVSAVDHYTQVFYEQISNLYYLPKLFDFNSKNNTFTFIENQVTHDVGATLNEDYETVSSNDCNDNSLIHYQANYAAHKQIAKFLNYLRDNFIYDNTRIIVVSDHGANIQTPANDSKISQFSALLLVKDFNSNNELAIDNTFMTNADTLHIAIKDLNISNKNPFTGKTLVQEKDSGITIFECIDWNAENFKNNKKFELDKNKAYHVSDNIYDSNNWIPLTEWETKNGGL